jgi:hypothetical protein
MRLSHSSTMVYESGPTWWGEDIPGVGPQAQRVPHLREKYVGI